MMLFANKDYDYATKIDFGKFVSLEDNLPSILTSWVIAQIKQIQDYEVFEVTREVGFSDYVSCSAYKGNHSYWWIIKIFNDILDEEELVYGAKLKIPTPNAVNKILAEVQAKETLYNNNKFENLKVFK